LVVVIADTVASALFEVNTLPGLLHAVDPIPVTFAPTVGLFGPKVCPKTKAGTTKMNAKMRINYLCGVFQQPLF